MQKRETGHFSEKYNTSGQLSIFHFCAAGTEPVISSFHLTSHPATRGETRLFRRPPVGILTNSDGARKKLRPHKQTGWPDSIKSGL